MKDGMMSKSQQKQTKQPKTGRKTGRKPRGITSNKPASQASPARKSGVLNPPRRGSMSRRRKAKPKPGEGAERLCAAVDKLVSEECGRIARALVDKTISGNMAGARLVAELSGAKNPRNKPVKKWLGPSRADQWAAEPQWKGPSEDDEETGAPAFERSA